MSQVSLPAALVLAALLPGCMTMAPSFPAPGEAAVRAEVRLAEAELRALVNGLSDPVAVADFDAARTALLSARTAVATDAVIGGLDVGLALNAERAALGVTLGVCAEAVERLAAAPRPEAARMVRGPFAFTCLTPLSLFALR
jgi:hypothetical protein